MEQKPATMAPSLLMKCTDNTGKITDLATYKKYERALKITDTLTAPNFITLTHQDGEKATIQRLYNIISEGVAPFKVSNPMTARDILSAAIDILGAFGTDTPEDLIITLKNARTGLYGEIYNRVDGPLIMGWLKEHLNDKYQAKETALNNIKAEKQKFTGVEDAQALLMLSKIRASIEAKTAAQDPTPRKNETLEGWITAIEQRAASMTAGELQSIRRQLIQNNVTGAVQNEINRIDKLIKNAIKNEKGI